MGLTIYQSITPADRPVEQATDGAICGSGHNYQIRKWLGVRRSSWLLFFYVLGYSAYLIGGSFLFCSIEMDNEQHLKSDISRRKEEFVLRYPEVDPEDLENLISDITYHGISPLEKSKNNSNWSFGQSFLFTVTIVTTIGYGHINPVTPAGKLTCIVYAILGIPFTLMFLSALVQRLLSPTYSFLSSLLEKLSNFGHLEVRLVHLATMGTIFILLAFLAPSVVFWALEPGWSFLDSVYFVFISLTTIGLGDYIPGDSDETLFYRDLYKTSVGIYLLFGLVMLSLTLTVYYDIPQLNLGLHLHRHRDIYTGERNGGRNHKDSELNTNTNCTMYRIVNYSTNTNCTMYRIVN
ncbi:potassium channel subfamily K member 1 isoform X2 [Eurytemora carolleeae]|uniref:potassium channel subfamily K member 1 isoform X2 n=1 Tax=Eurytemora carolleeae TaxID=1294199 RepID=UPI000C75BDE9|nr:potassium channel subfamily K member 1 isoform X2 [Eurytemora carolleeae]|eukprot:XP_023348818.1 potassium channel subfamily K member 1-like isoform X2 [Eurytemora affinis]